jgi:hypothetical protein
LVDRKAVAQHAVRCAAKLGDEHYGCNDDGCEY